MNFQKYFHRSAFLVCLTGYAVASSSGCSDGSNATSRSQGPAADLSEELTGVNSPFIGAAVPARLHEFGYVEHEYVASGNATSYRATTPLTEDGRWSFEPDDTALYRTRILVRRPDNPANFSGTVLVEWNNVSGGVDANPEYVAIEEEITRRGHAWVGVSAQRLGVEGGPVLVSVPGSGADDILGKGLKKIDPDRYGSLQHPGDGYSFDIFTQVARALKESGPATGHMEPRQLIAVGESQSAMALVTYYNGVQPLVHIFDGFFIHSRASFGLPLVGPGEFTDIAKGFGTIPSILRTDLDVPVLNQQAENDVVGVLNSIIVRQPDSDTFRLWEVAGTAHADARQLGPSADNLDCGAPINNGPQHMVAKAALNSLDKWLRTGKSPPAAQRLELTSTNPPTLRRDADGIVQGGIRTPQVDVPVDVLSGMPGPNPDIICILLGSTTPLSADRLAELYASRDDYEQRYVTATEAVIKAGFVLEGEREALLADSAPSRISN